MKINTKKPIRIDYYPKTEENIYHKKEIDIKENINSTQDIEEDEILTRHSEEKSIIEDTLLKDEVSIEEKLEEEQESEQEQEEDEREEQSEVLEQILKDD